MYIRITDTSHPLYHSALQSYISSKSTLNFLHLHSCYGVYFLSFIKQSSVRGPLWNFFLSSPAQLPKSARRLITLTLHCKRGSGVLVYSVEIAEFYVDANILCPRF